MSETDLERFPLPLNKSKKIGLVSFDARVNAGWQRPCLCCLLPSLLAPECLRGAWTTAVRSVRIRRELQQPAGLNRAEIWLDQVD